MVGVRPRGAEDPAKQSMHGVHNAFKALGNAPPAALLSHQRGARIWDLLTHTPARFVPHGFFLCRPTHGNNVVDASPHVRVKLLGLRAKVRVTWVRVRGKGLTLTLTLSLSPNPNPKPGQSIDRMHCFAP